MMSHLTFDLRVRVWCIDIDNALTTTTNPKETQNEERTFRFIAHSTTALLPPLPAPPHRVIPVPPCVPHPVPPSTTVYHLRLYSLLTISLSTESSSDLEPIHAAHLPDRAFSLMTIPLDGLRSAIDCANGSLRTINGPSYSAPPTSHHFSVPSRRHELRLRE
ncbi:hypothetical protein F5888DRAFT_1103694 [Russula emetica]|nr:hypothetical protein F5888DRAFT_1103694 [Russula emetica]